MCQVGAVWASWMGTPEDQDREASEQDRPRDDNDCTPNHLCNGRMVHLPGGEMCDKCGVESLPINALYPVQPAK